MKQQLKNFFETTPLLTKEYFDQPLKSGDLKIEYLDYDCKECGKNRVFKNLKTQNSGGGAGGGTGGGAFVPMEDNSGIKAARKYFEFQCTACQSPLEFWIEYKKDGKIWVRKLGQFPSWDIQIENDLEDFLGAEAVFLKKGKICLSQSFGLAACSYFRRVLENEIGPLLDLLIEIKERNGVNEDKLEEYKQVSNGKDFSTKSNLALEIAPESLIIDGINPFKIIHDFLSKGIHSLAEEECQDIAQKTLSALKFVVVKLNREKKQQEEFIQDLKSLEKQRN
jgi:hypothetical protein